MQQLLLLMLRLLSLVEHEHHHLLPFVVVLVLLLLLLSSLVSRVFLFSLYHKTIRVYNTNNKLLLVKIGSYSRH